MDGCEEVVFLVVEHIVAHGHTRCDEFGDPPLHHFVHLGEPLLSFNGCPFLLGILQLVADGHTFTGPDEFGEIGIEGVVGESRHSHVARTTAVVALGQGDAENA